MDITRETVIGEIVENCPEAMPVFQGIGMHCIGCPSAQGESIEEACMVHGLDVEPLVEEINAYLSSK